MTGAMLPFGNAFRIRPSLSELHAGIEPDPKLVQRFPVHVGTTAPLTSEANRPSQLRVHGPGSLQRSCGNRRIALCALSRPARVGGQPRVPFFPTLPARQPRILGSCRSPCASAEACLTTVRHPGCVACHKRSGRGLARYSESPA
jgi:hypothetical protein